MIDWTSSSGLEVGETVRVFGPPPLTWWDLFLWRVFSIERKRENVWQNFTVTAKSEGESMTAQEPAQNTPPS